MRKYIYLFAFGFLFFSCDKKSKIEREVEKIPVTMKVIRFEQAFFNATPQELPMGKDE